MSQHDFNIANQTFPSFRADLNDALVAAATTSSGASAPTTPYPYQLWYDTTTEKYKVRNAANSAWIDIFGLDASGNITIAADLSVDGGTIKLDGNYPVGTENVALGDAALDSVESGGQYNVAIGSKAGTAITTGDQNVAVGAYSLDATTTGGDNTAVGKSALGANTTASNNTAVGTNALLNNTTASNGTAVGYHSLYSNTTGASNTGIGTYTLAQNTTGAGNFAGGYNALGANTTGASNVGLGFRALQSNTTGNDNVAVGQQALEDNTASGNTALGYAAMYQNISGANNVGLGYLALGQNTTASGNTAVGYQAGYSNSTGTYNAMFGFQAGQNITSTYNTFVGTQAGQLVTSGGKNTILGLYNGNQGGLDIRTSSNNIVLSDGDGNPRVYVNSSGSVLIGTTTDGTTADGFVARQSAETIITRTSNAPLLLNRAGTDGAILQFRAQNVLEGYINVSGTTVSLVGGHLSRLSRLTSDSKDTSIVKGTVMTNLDEMVEWGDEDNEQLNKMAVSSVEGDANVAGVFVNWDNDDDWNDMNVAMTGDMVIRIAQGTTVARGDLLMSAGDGTAKPQGDDIVRSKTIAKVTSTHVSHTYDDGSCLVPCVLMAC